MKNTIKQMFVMIAVFIIALTNTSQAQAVYRLSDAKDINMKLSGTSTLHNWTMTAQNFKSEAQFVVKAGQLNSLKSLTFLMAVADLKSGESGLDKNAYKALKADNFKSISYKLTSATVLPGKGNKFEIKTEGSLTIAGVTKEVIVYVYAIVNANETITCTGSEKLNMTDFGIKPPKFMFGAMKTGDAITLDFTFIYKKQTGV
jgi:polyisoprenoid-binding protein YceI